MIGVFKQKSPGNIVLLAFLGLLLHLSLFLYPQAPVVRSEGSSPLYDALVRAIGPGNVWAASGLSFALLYVQALLLNFLVNEYRLTLRPTFLPGMAYLLITALLPGFSRLSPALVAATLVIWTFIRLFRLYSLSDARAAIYNIGLLGGITAALHPPAFLLLLPWLMGLMILKPFRFNELMLLITGVLTPVYFYAVYLFLADRLTAETLRPVVRMGVPPVQGTIPLAVATVLVGLPFLIGGYYVQDHLRKMLIQVRKNWSIVLLWLFTALITPFFNPQADLHDWFLAAAPFAAFHACTYLYPARRWLPLALFFITLAFIVWQQWAYFNPFGVSL